METDRSWPSNRNKYLILLIIFTVLLLPTQSRAGTVLLTAEPEAPLGPGDQAYAESRFGQPPAPPTITTGKSLTQREIRAQNSANRAPAGMMLPAGHENELSHPTRHGSNRAVQVPTPVTELEAIRRQGVQEVSVIAGDLGYFPKTIFVTRDVPVRLFVTGSSKDTLCFMMDSFQVRKQVRTEKIEEITFTPKSPGTYRFYCPIKNMEGTLVVKELAYEGRAE